MELQTALKTLADKIEQLKNQIETEESTKHAFILPFINLLGYDSFNPTEVVPEYTADIGLKKGEKVDYAIFLNEQPILIIECKHWKEDLKAHCSQLARYFHVTQTRFAVLTNGIEYQFFTDLEEANKMDDKPFLECTLTQLKENNIQELAKFHKSRFDVDQIVDNASHLKYLKEIKKIIQEQLQQPAPDFVKFFATRVHSGKRITERIVEEFSELVQKAFAQTLSERVHDRLNAALNKEAEQQQEEESIEEEKPKIITTEEELEGFRIVVAILRRKIPTTRITYRDTQSYFGILLDNNNRKPICRLHLDGTKKYISLFDAQKNVSKQLLHTIDAIYNFENILLQTIDYYETTTVTS